MSFASPPEPLRLVFEYSLRRRILAWALLAPIVNGFYVLAVVVEPPNLRADLILLLIGMAPEYQILIYWAERVRSARFYDDHVELHGRKTNRVLAYSDIREAKLRKGEVRPTSIAIFLKGEPGPIVLRGNPVGEDGKIDLYNWLQGKVRESGRSGSEL
jgi:hypothetical protein